jgi:ATP-dependent helicase/nuclease subunit B
MEAVDPAKTELDELDFGILCHAALEAMGREPALRDCTDAVVIREFLLAEIDRVVTWTYGAELTLPLVVQVESARQRLSRAAAVQAQIRTDGWVIEHVERKFEIEAGGLVVVGKIDRIDRHEGTGAVRVLDYKTSDKPVSPVEAHLRGLRRDETAPKFARLLHGGRERVWRDLQLPLYLRALAAEYPGGVTCGYFNLPKAATETGLALWEDYTHGLAESAWKCAEGVTAAVRTGVFWPPNETVREDHDVFATLFHHGVAGSVAWEEEAS